ncbi:MAG TPA: serine hydrolase domain-containing protein [Pyrinomonadaceae bacterium]
MQRISRRQILTSGLKTTVGLVLLKDMTLGPVVVEATRDDRAALFQPAFARLDEFIGRHLTELGAPGMTVALADRKGLLRASQYGLADVKARIPVKADTLFEIGSISKSFVAIAALQLADEGKLDLQKPVKDYLPWLKIESSYAPFTAHHLLSHTSGLSGVPLLIRVATSTLRTGSPPGTEFVYSNIGYVLIGLLLETIDKRPLGEILRARVLDLLGMNSSAPIITDGLRERLAVGYSPLYEDRPFPLRGKLSEAPWLEVPEAAGSVAATASDMGAYLQMLLNRGVGPRGRLISEKAFDLLSTAVIKAPFRGEEASYGYGLWNSSAKGHTLLRHTGGMVAFSSAMYADLTDGLAAFASVNARLGGYRPIAVTRYALDLLSAAAVGKDLPAAPTPPPPPDTIRNAADFAGTFTSTDADKLVLVAEGEQLILNYKGQRVVLEQSGRDRFIVKHPEFEMFILSFGRDKDVVVEAFHGARWWTNDHYNGPKTFSYPPDWDVFTGRYRSDSPWYGSTRIIIRKGRLMADGEQALTQIEPGVFRPDGDGNGADRVSFDTALNGKTMHLNYSGIDFYRTFTP